MRCHNRTDIKSALADSCPTLHALQAHNQVEVSTRVCPNLAESKQKQHKAAHTTQQQTNRCKVPAAVANTMHVSHQCCSKASNAVLVKHHVLHPSARLPRADTDKQNRSQAQCELKIPRLACLGDCQTANTGQVTNHWSPTLPALCLHMTPLGASSRAHRPPVTLKTLASHHQGFAADHTCSQPTGVAWRPSQHLAPPVHALHWQHSTRSLCLGRNTARDG